MAANSETEINLKTLKRVDSNIIEIIDTASQVAIYKYERKLNKWEGTDIEGTLFLYRRSLYPFHGFIIVNRMSTTNFVEDITNDMEFLLQEPYFLYKKSCGEIIGSWFYEERDFRRITNKIQSIVLKQETPLRRQRCSSDSDSQLKIDNAVQDIMTMLSEAHSEYVKSENVTTPEKRIDENFNNLNSFSDKELSNKTVNSSGKKSKSPLRVLSVDKYPVSPRRRFLSTGSYDPNHFKPLESKKIMNDLISSSALFQASTATREEIPEAFDKSFPLDSVNFLEFPLQNIRKSAVPTRLSPLFSCDEIAMPTVPSQSDEKADAFEVSLDQLILGPITPNKLLGDNKPSFQTAEKNKADYAAHSSSLKETLCSHLEWNSDIMLKIHEAYVASLKSHFVPKKS